MSYTMTVDMPPKAAAYVKLHEATIRSELNAIFVALIRAKMQCEGETASADADMEVPGKTLRASFREGDRIISGKKKTKWYGSAKELVEDCLA